jgi:hypothetical protein
MRPAGSSAWRWRRAAAVLCRARRRGRRPQGLPRPLRLRGSGGRRRQGVLRRHLPWPDVRRVLRPGARRAGEPGGVQACRLGADVPAAAAVRFYDRLACCAMVTVCDLVRHKILLKPAARAPRSAPAGRAVRQLHVPTHCQTLATAQVQARPCCSPRAGTLPTRCPDWRTRAHRAQRNPFRDWLIAAWLSNIPATIRKP